MDASLAHVIAVAQSRFAAKARLTVDGYIPRLAASSTARALQLRDAALEHSIAASTRRGSLDGDGLDGGAEAGGALRAAHPAEPSPHDSRAGS